MNWAFPDALKAVFFVYFLKGLMRSEIMGLDLENGLILNDFLEDWCWIRGDGAQPANFLPVRSGYFLSGGFPGRLSMSVPRQGETVKVTLRNGETVEGVVVWINGNGAWIKGPQKSRWIPVEALLVQDVPKKETSPEE